MPTHPFVPYLHLLVCPQGVSSQDPTKSQRLGHFPPSSPQHRAPGMEAPGMAAPGKAAPGKAAPGKVLRRLSCPRTERAPATSRRSHKRADDAQGRCNVWSSRVPSSDNSFWSSWTGSFRGFTPQPDVGGSLPSPPDTKFLLQNEMRLMLLQEKPPESFSTRVNPNFSALILANFLLQKVSRKKKNPMKRDRR